MDHTISVSHVVNCYITVADKKARHRIWCSILKTYTHRIELVLSLHVVLDEHDVVHCLFQFERVLFARLYVTHRLI